MADGQVVFEITADKKPIGQALSDTTRMIQQESGKWDQAAKQSTDNIGNNFAGMFKKISVAVLALKAGEALLDLGKDAIAAASDLREVQNVVDVTFGSNAGQIETWAKNASAQFGLTETQAKKFTSTLGAMMKSAGLAGPEIVNMSTDLAGLAADMASFYNLDFDTAFQKIRSGISGETEPLKQLGVNMSVANLEAYALSKGITKAFNDMSQGEQTMLRYQYLMQATADAQGDFARTSDGYANSMRRIDTALTSIKTSIGKAFLPIVEAASSGLANFLEKITVPKPRTVLDEFADINLDTANKLKEIEETSAKARDLIATLGGIAESAVDLSKTSGLTSFIESFSGKITGLDGALQKAKENNVNGALSDLSSALSADLGGDPDKWEKLLGTISDKLPGAGIAAAMDGGKTAGFMAAAAAAADDLGEDYSELWHKLLTVLGDDAPDAISALMLAGNTGTNLSSLAAGANGLNANSPKTWTDLFNALQKVDGLDNIFSSSGAGNVKDLADALSSNAPDADKAAAWQTFLDALGTNTGALANLTGESAEETSEWLQKMKEAANGLDPTDAEAWNKLLANFVDGLPGLKDTEGGKAFFEAVAANFLAMGAESEEAKAGLAALGLSSAQIDTKQKQWLQTCKELVQTIPELSSIINTETGEVKGGVVAMEEHVDAYQKMQEKEVYLAAYYAKQKALAEGKESLKWLELTKIGAEKRAKAAAKAYQEAYEAAGGAAFDVEYGTQLDSGSVSPDVIKTHDLLTKLASASGKANLEAKDATDKYNNAVSALAPAMRDLENAASGYHEIFGEDITATNQMTEAVEESAQSMTLLQQAANGTEGAMDQVKTALKNTQDALKALNDYQEKVMNETESSVYRVIKGFDSLGKKGSGNVWQFNTPVGEAKQKVVDLRKEANELEKKINNPKKFNLDSKDVDKLDTQLKNIKKQISQLEGDKPSVQNMTQALESQLQYIREYQRLMNEARKNGVSDDILAMLSDGSQESFDYLKALSEGGGSIADLNEKYQQVQEAAEGFTNSLTNQKLTADKTYKDLVQTARDAVAELNMGQAAHDSVAATVGGIVQALGDKKSEVAKEVDGILAELERLTGNSAYGAKVSRTVYFAPNTNILPFGKSKQSDGNHANGLEHVPFDGYLAMLHQGERVQTAAEAELSRRYSVQRPEVDYGSIGGAIGAGMPGMQIVWRGRVVADVLSEQQGDSYRALERSGWRS